MSGLVAVESQIASTAQRHFQLRAAHVESRRGDGWLLLTFPPLPEENQISAEVQALCTALVRDVTSSRVATVQLSGDTDETKFGQLAEKGLPFSALLQSAGIGGDGDEDAVKSLPDIPGVVEMVKVLYDDVTAENKNGARAIVDFPKLLCPTGARCDVIVQGVIAVKAFSSTSESLVPIGAMELPKGRRSADLSNGAAAKSGAEKATADGASDVDETDDAAAAASSTEYLSTSLEGSMLQNSYSLVKLPTGALAKVWLDTRVWAHALAAHAGTSVETELPAAWRSKSFSLPEAGEVLSLVHQTLIEFWNRNHMTNTERTKINTLSLLSMVSGDLREYLSTQIGIYSPDWRAIWRMQIDELRTAVQVCKVWNQIVAQLVKVDWANWEGGMFHDESFDSFSKRLHDALRVRETVTCMTALQETVPPTAQPETIFEGVVSTDVRNVEPATWDACVALFDKEVSYLEPSLRNRVKQLFQGGVSDSQLRIVQRYKALFRRDGIRTAVSKDLDGIVQYLIDYLNRIYARYENNYLRATSPLQKLRTTKGCLAECVSVPERAMIVFGSTAVYTKTVVDHAQGLITKASEEATNIIQQWCSAVEATAQKVMKMEDAVVVEQQRDEKTKSSLLLTCSVNPSLLQFVNEGRNFQAWLSDVELSGRRGKAAVWKVNAATESAIRACENLYNASVKTQQCVANHNTVVAQILPCTRRMLIPAIQRSMNQILYADTTKRVIAASNYQELEGLNLRFQNSIEAFSNLNRQIRRFHHSFATQVVDLMLVDLTKQMDQWRTLVDDMRSRFDEFLAQQHLTDYDDWRRHWDAQIYKSLEYQYRRGLEYLHEDMEEFKVELVLKQGLVQYKPSLEALREAYYVKLREFVSVPLRFRGLQPKRADNTVSYELYPSMSLSNHQRIITVHTKAIELFAKLNRVRKAFRPHIIIGLCGTGGAPDLDAVVEKWGENHQERFTDGLRTVQEHKEKLNIIEDVMKVDCFSISTIPVKVSVEEHLYRLEESLLNGMRKSIQTAVNDVDDFIFQVSNVVERQPTTMDEVGEANKKYHDYLTQMDDYGNKLKAILEQNKELRNHFGTSLELGVTQTRWDHLKEAMVSHTKTMDAAVAKMRVSLDGLIQRFLKDVQRFADNWKRQKALLMKGFVEKQTATIKKLLPALKDQLNDLEDLKVQATEMESKCEYFNQPKPAFSVLASTISDVEETSGMWSLYDSFQERLETLRNEDWLTFRAHTYQFVDFCQEWRSKLTKHAKKSGGGDSATEGGATNPIIQYLLTILKEWADVEPLLKFIRGEGWMTEHWNEMFRLMDIPKGTTSTSLTFGMILDHYEQLLEKQSELKLLHARAQGEIQLREALQDLRTWALEATFALTAPSETTSKLRLITDWKEILTQLSDNQALVNSLKDSPFFVHFADEASGWETKLVSLQQSLTLLNNIQRRWAYLEPIFARGALPHEQARFKRVDKEFVGILREVEADPRVMSLAAQTDVNDKLKGILEQIERCQKSLMEYLEAKRNKLPRFYFISDEDLLEMLAHSQSPAVIQAHLKKLFMGIHSVEFNEDETAITHMISADLEKVQLKQPVPITSNDVEDWLLALDDRMRTTLQELLVRCVAQPDPTSFDSVRQYPSQILQVAQGVQFSMKVEEAIASGNLRSVVKLMQSRLNQLTSMTPELDDVNLLKVKALILDTIHNTEVVELLLDEQVRHVNEWWWQKQLRYRMSPDTKKCTVHMVDTSFDYTYEYQGNAAKLVHTPLTDKCYLVLTKGMDLGYGGNPYGPAGTGKTESVKALGSAMGRQVLVFNCDEGIDFKAMGRIFVGIVKCGAWGCFDEFNRLKIDQLSAISQMIQVIQQALKNREPNTILLSKEIDVNPNAGIFVTLNPAGKGYGGRTRLPDNLKQLFREVAMSVPDNELITATMLLSEGFTHARALAKDVVELYKLCGQLMSRQQHYDWGLRPLKAVLRLGGTLVQRWRKEHGGQKTPTEEEESEIMIQSLNINTLSKLTYEDARVFSGLLRDVFPGVESREVTYGELEAAVQAAVTALGLQLIPSQQKKVLQLYEALNQRTGVVLVGPSGSGKSTLLYILRKALQIMKVEVPLHVMNPKAMPRRRLLGFMDPDTREWHDGVLTAAARDVVKEPKTSRPWIMCDGDIDPEWIESLNSVLDDNKLLTMPNGVRIQFGANVNFIFETHSLEYASPATVSRMGVLFFSEKDVQLEAVVESAMAKQAKEKVKNVMPLILKYVFAAIDEAQRLHAFSVATTRMGLLSTCLLHVMNTKTEADFVYSLARGLGACLTADGAAKLARWVFATSGQRPCSENRPLETYWDNRQKRAVEFTADLTTSMTPADFLAGRPPVVKTVEVQRLVATLNPLIEDENGKPLFVVGPEGCGKAALLEYAFTRFPGVRTTTLNCSAQTSSTHLIQKLEESCTLATSNQGTVYRPKEGDRLVIILKGVNLPKADRYGTVELHSFLLQLILYKGFYNQDLEWIGVERVQLVASMNPAPSAGRYPVTPRLLAVASIVTVAYPSKASLLQIYSSYWAALLRQTSIGLGKDYEKGTQLAQFMLNVYDKVRRRFEGDEYAHLSFCPRHLTKWVSSTLLYEINTQTTLPAVLAYEADRIFADCLPTAEDRGRAGRIFAEQLATIGYAAPAKDDRYATMFVTWFNQASAAAINAADATGAAPATEEQQGNDRDDTDDLAAPAKAAVIQLQQKKYDDVQEEVVRGLLRYSREFKELNVPLIPDIVSWVTRVDRVLARRGGHVILVGSTGVGRRNAVLLASYMQHREVVTLNMTQDYGLKQFRLELRGYIQRATTQNMPLLLLLEDHQIVSESFLEYVNSLLSSGDVPGLFTQEEMETMYSAIREEASNDGHMGSIYTYFIDRLNRNLRVALLMDNRHELFLVRLQSNPALMNRCELLWMGTWSGDVTRAICKVSLKELMETLEANPANKGFHLHREIYAIHEAMGEASTPRDVQVLIATFQHIMGTKSNSSKEKIERLEAGLAKLKEAEESVEGVKKDVASKKKSVEKMQKEADKALNEIQKSMQDSQEQRDEAATLQTTLKEEHKQIVLSREQVEAELGSIKPMMEAARDAVSSIRSEQLNEIRSLKAPPEAVRDVLEGVLALLGVTDVSWQSMRKFLGERGVKERILEFNVKNVTPSIRSSVQRLLQQKGGSFKPDVIRRASVAAAPMAEWVKAMIEYSSIMERIAPLTTELNDLETNQREGEEKLEQLRHQLKKIDVKVEQLRDGFSEKCKEAERLRGKLQSAEEELAKAQDLLDKLSGEKGRWAKDAEVIREDSNLMPKRALISAAFMTYLGQQTEDGRQKNLKAWCSRLNLSGGVDVTKFLHTEGELLQCKAEGLPSDDLSVENAVVMMDTLQTPLVVDPANKAVEWMKEHLRVSNTVVDVISLHDERFTHTLELAIRFGKTLLVTEVGDIAPLLYPILRRDLITAGAKRVVQLGAKAVEWQDSFRILLFSRQSEVRLSPGAAALVSEINFSVTSLGLEGQLLGVTIQHEKPELEKQKGDLLKREEDLQLELSKLEERLLNDLADSQGNLLENTKLIKSLNEVKVQSSTIQESLQQSRDLQVELDGKREVYRPFANHGARLFFIVKDMERLNRMYQYGITDYIDMFTATLNAYKGSSEPAEKVTTLRHSFTRTCFHYVSRGLLKKDRLVFGLHVIHGLWAKTYPSDQWDALLGTVAEGKHGGDASVPQWAPVSSKVKYAAIASCASGEGLIERWKLSEASRWTPVMQSAAPEAEMASSLGIQAPMEQLLLTNTFRPDRFSSAALRIVLEQLKLKSLAPVVTLEDTILSSRNTAPILLITSSGADPSMEVQDIAEHRVGKERFVQIALGGGQTEEAMRQVRRCAAQGDWLLLKNLHLVLDWAAALENELCAMPEPSRDFRLLITTEPHDLFPNVLLRMSNKITVEAPPGVKQNMLRTYGLWDAAFLESYPPVGAQVLMGLAWFHAVVQERRTYVPQGWSKYYEFSPADLKTATDVLTALTRKKEVDWVTLTGMLRACLYGGRLEKTVDEEVLGLLVHTYFNADVLLKEKSQLYPGLSVGGASNHDAVLQMLHTKLPDVDPPAMLRLCENADRTVQEELAHGTTEALRELSRVQHSSHGSGERLRELLVPVLEMWRSSGLPADGSPRSITSESKDPGPMEVFFVSEVNLLAALIDDLAAFFTTLRGVAEGTIIPDETLRGEATELMGGRMPSRWLDRMDGPQEASLWLALLNRKYATTKSCVTEPLRTSQAYDLSSFLRPQTFFNALRQHTAWSTRSPLVNLKLVAGIGSVANATVSVHVSGSSILVQGATLSSDGRVSAVTANSPSSVPVGTNIAVGWVPTEKSSPKDNTAAIPVYSNSDRQSLIFTLFADCSRKDDIASTKLNGVACYLVNI